jgi:hypothetical protein
VAPAWVVISLSVEDMISFSTAVRCTHDLRLIDYYVSVDTQGGPQEYPPIDDEGPTNSLVPSEP